MVHSSVEKLCDAFAQRVLCLTNGLVVPHKNGFSVKSQGAEKDKNFYSSESRCIDRVESFATSEDALSRMQREHPPPTRTDRTMKHDVNAVLRQVRCTVKEVSGESSFLPIGIDSLCVYRVIIIYFHCSRVCKNS